MIEPSAIDLPERAHARLRGMRAGAGGPSLFTGNLSTGELLLVREAGYEPLGLVVGASIYHIGYQRSRWRQNMELEVLSQAMYRARALAMRRLEAEATLLGAGGVIGVRLGVGRHGLIANTAEFTAIGTAVRRSAGPDRQPAGGRPFTSAFSGEEFRTLLQAGYAPRALVLGSCVYHVAHRTLRQWFGTSLRNAELPNFTQALYEARELAMGRMQREATEAGAEGIVGANIHERSHGWGGHVIEFLALGTAVAALADTPAIPEPRLVFPLNADRHPPSVTHYGRGTAGTTHGADGEGGDSGGDGGGGDGGGGDGGGDGGGGGGS